MAYTIVYSESFRQRLEQLIEEWENELFLSKENIHRFIRMIYQSIELTKNFPEMHEEISALYHFHECTYRILIGNKYAIFYRIDKKKQLILVGNIFERCQMKISFQ
ncbi:type II toxin-antitoxin system RelE/ParE family toxin [Enterococcus mundtii]|uniref:toxin RelE n=1 Tax=Enterococcus TaxID=1350 RepID=UPI00044BFEA6|nr:MULTISPECIES: toxin RelE [Enterococcus]AZP91954.1 addiction module toxin RelE [Enterococcus mundtii]EYT94873.1 toxin RelE [Enterococcus mundtii CRL35]MDK4210932.1 type II toxin-antitoxin system RelE/ParE family toxin [Enterococcus mundtii]MDO7879356.1 type II toxin-antitoxin system RelE/ParE family toxin [Enterococcus mundtii]MEC3940949.1 type II toxin-antitoxin system RelE/ParE family toxin [Enterococcus mundtii]